MGTSWGRSTGAALTAVACAALLAGCTEEVRVTAAAGPTVTATAAPPDAAARAERYRAAGGDADVYGIQRESGPQGVPLLIVRTRNADADAALFDRQSASITSWLSTEEGLSLRAGYLMDVFGPDGALLHRLDARP
ncbi:hypothetical protein ACGFYU_04455 [Streptomyces sp. NPDC048337]|uniref:hypothetical protein n=1 Tax=Streptomyces sp. NPDC048337 TaxID=3365535 RepID=UPI00370FA89A